jgi:hypothetical protein
MLPLSSPLSLFSTDAQRYPCADFIHQIRKTFLGLRRITLQAELPGQR